MYSPRNKVTSRPSHSTSMSSSISSVHNSPDVPNSPHTTSSLQNEYVSRIQKFMSTESEHIHRIQELGKRCAISKERVIALNLKYARLLSIHHNLVMRSRHFLVSIPSVLLLRQEGSNKTYFAYEIRITPASGEDNESWSLLRRYSEFHRLDKYLRKSDPIINVLDFPPKRIFGNMNSEFVEMRRQRLQVYLLSVLSLMPEISKCTTRTRLEQAFPFFKQSHRL